MARDFVRASTQNLSAYPTVVPVGGEAATLVCWVRPDSQIGPGVHISFPLNLSAWTPAPSGGYVLTYSDHTAGVFHGAMGWGAGSVLQYDIVAGHPVSQDWQHWAGTFAADGTVEFFLNGVWVNNQGGAGATAETLDIVVIGSGAGSEGFNSYFDGQIAEAAVYNVILTAAEMLQLAAGFSPRFVRPQSLVCYYPLIREIHDYGPQGATLTNDGTTVFPHPRVIYSAPVTIIGLKGRNDFTGDTACKALWNMETGALTADSIGTNTLTAQGAPAASPDHRQGAYSADFTGATPDYFNITDGNLDAGFPLKSGDTTKLITVCGWFKFDATTGYVVNKYDTGGERTFAIGWAGDDALQIFVGYNNGDSFEIVYDSLDDDAVTLSTGRWYHYGITYNANDRTWKARVWDDTGVAIVINASGTGAETMYIGTSDVRIGARNAGLAAMDGHQDEIVVFNRILSTTHIDEIRQGIYDYVTPVANVPEKWHHYSKNLA